MGPIREHVVCGEAGLPFRGGVVELAFLGSSRTILAKAGVQMLNAFHRLLALASLDPGLRRGGVQNFA